MVVLFISWDVILMSFHFLFVKHSQSCFHNTLMTTPGLTGVPPTIIPTLVASLRKSWSQSQSIDVPTTPISDLFALPSLVKMSNMFVNSKICQFI